MVADKLPIYLWLDDAHWMSPEASAFVDALIRRRPSNVCLIVTTRNENVQADLTLQLDGLSEQAARDWCAAVGRNLAVHGAANPMLLGMALESNQDTYDASAVIRARVLEVDERSHEVLALAAIATTPLDRPTLNACGVSESEVEHLLGRGLLVVGRMDGQPAVEPVHDLVRSTCRTVLETKLAEQRLLDVLMAGTPVHANRVAHHMSRLDDERTAVWALRAADDACKAFAWQQASDWYAMAAKHGQHGADIDRLHAETLTRAGRVPDALAAWTRVAQTAPDKPSRVLAFTHGATVAYGSGDLLAGHALAKPAARELGMRMYTTMLGSLWQTAWWTARRWLWMRQGSPKGSPDAEAVLRLDLGWAVSGALGSIEGTLGVGWHARHRYESERFGSGLDVARGRAASFTYDVGPGISPDTSDQLLHAMEDFASDSSAAEERAVYLMGSGYGCFTAGEMAVAQRHLTLSAEAFEELSHNGWEREHAERHLAWIARYRGDYSRMTALGDAAIIRGERSGSLVHELQTRLGARVYQLMLSDQPEACAAEVASIEEKAGKHAAFGIRYLIYHARLWERLYVGDVEHVQTAVRGMMRSDFHIRALLHGRLESTLALAHAAVQCPGPKRLVLLKRYHRKLSREPARWPTACARALAGCIAWLSDDPAESGAAFQDAASQFDAIGMHATADACRAHVDALAGHSDPLKPLVQLGIVNPKRFLRTLVPGPASHEEFRV
ncbi:MAG: hypothetical protein ACJARS_001505 [bacterium]|jgi:hypothetical protein